MRVGERQLSRLQTKKNHPKVVLMFFYPFLPAQGEIVSTKGFSSDIRLDLKKITHTTPLQTMPIVTTAIITQAYRTDKN